MSPPVVIHLHRQAPTKPAVGAPCNGCGVCCALETCPLGRLRFLQANGPCPALEWHDERYRCGLLTSPLRYFPGWPAGLAAWLGRWAARWISAGSGCDCDWAPEAEES